MMTLEEIRQCALEGERKRLEDLKKIEQKPSMSDEELTTALKLALDNLATGRILAVKMIVRDILDKRGVVSQAVDDAVLKGLKS